MTSSIQGFTRANEKEHFLKIYLHMDNTQSIATVPYFEDNNSNDNTSFLDH